jgi:hypothetical protein
VKNVISASGREWVHDTEWGHDSNGPEGEYRAAAEGVQVAVRRRRGKWWCQDFETDDSVHGDCHKVSAFGPIGYTSAVKAIAAADEWFDRRAPMYMMALRRRAGDGDSE